MPKSVLRLIQYQPYEHRNECCAVGLFVFSSNKKVSVVTASNLKKVKAIDPSCDLTALREGLERIALELQESPEAIAIYEQGFNGIKLAKSDGFISHQNQEEFDTAVQWALKTSVEPRVAYAKRDRQVVSRLYLEVKKVFNDFGWLAKPSESIADHKIIPRFSLSADEGLTVDFALKNGVMNCLQTIDYRHNTSAKKTEAQAKLLTLGYSHQLYEGAKAYAVIAGSSEPEAKSGLKLAERTVDDFFIHESSEDMARLMDRISSAIGQEPLPSLSAD